MPSAVSVLMVLRQEIDTPLPPRGVTVASKVEHEFVDVSLSLFLKERIAMQTCEEVEVELHAFIILVIRECELST